MASALLLLVARGRSAGRCAAWSGAGKLGATFPQAGRAGCSSVGVEANVLARPFAAEAEPQPDEPPPEEPEETLEEVRARIFGLHIGDGLQSGRKVLRKKLIGDKITRHYLEPIEKTDPKMIDLDAERHKEKLDMLRRRGKAPAKKGQGKRSGKKKK